jgi:hypothetical protein
VVDIIMVMAGLELPKPEVSSFLLVLSVLISFGLVFLVSCDFLASLTRLV